ncbi:MAG: restriction endonuclease subunit S, partial [Chlorobium sp.]|nr:restriction endonuclease subunit S [Chlorobium sp.]
MTKSKSVGRVRPEAVSHQSEQVPRPLCDIVDIVSGFGFPKDKQGKVEGELPFFKVGDISSAWKNGQKKLRQAQHYIDNSEAKVIKARPFPKGTVVFAKIGEAIKLNRRAILGQPSIIDNNVMGLIPRDGVVDGGYLFYWTLTLRLGDISQATTVPSVRKSDVEQLAFPWVPLEQQKRIVAEIEKQFSRLD